MANYVLEGLAPPQQAPANTILQDVLNSILQAQKIRAQSSQSRNDIRLKRALRGAVRAREAGTTIAPDDIATIYELTGRNIDEFLDTKKSPTSSDIQNAITTVQSGEEPQKQISLDSTDKGSVISILEDAKNAGISSEQFAKTFAGEGVDRRYKNLKKISGIVDPVESKLSGRGRTPIGAMIYAGTGAKAIESRYRRFGSAREISDEFTKNDLEMMLEDDAFREYWADIQNALKRKR